MNGRPEELKDDKTSTTAPVVRPKIDKKAKMLAGSISSFITEVTWGWALNTYQNNLMAKGKMDMSLPLTKRFTYALFGKDYHSLTAYQAARVYYRGFPAYAVYRNLSLGGGVQTLQPIVEEWIKDSQLHSSMGSHIGKDNAGLVTAGMSGVIAAVPTGFLAPLERLKQTCQLEKLTVRAGFWRLYPEGWPTQFAAAWPLFARNAIGAGAFGAGRYVGYRMLGVTDYKNMTSLQSMVSALTGSFFMITASHFPDVVKVRRQQDPTISNYGMFKSLRRIVETEGVAALGRGYSPKMFNYGVKMTVMTMFADWLTLQLSKKTVDESERQDSRDIVRSGV